MAEVQGAPLVQSGMDPFGAAARAAADDPAVQDKLAAYRIDYATRFARHQAATLSEGYDGSVANAIADARVQYERQVERILRERGGSADQWGFGPLMPREQTGD